MNLKPPQTHPDAPMVGLEDLDFRDGGLLDRVAIGRLALSGREAADLTVRQVVFTKTHLVGAILKRAQLSDVLFVGCDLSGLDLTNAGLQRVAFRDCRLSGVQFGDAALKHVTFKGSKLDLTNFRFATLDHVHFAESDLREADFYQGTLTTLEFERCTLTGTSFANASLDDVDLRGSDLSRLTQAAGLAGATVSSTQLFDIAPLLARELGLNVVD